MHSDLNLILSLFIRTVYCTQLANICAFLNWPLCLCKKSRKASFFLFQSESGLD